MSQVDGLAATSAFAEARSTVALRCAVVLNKRRADFLKITDCPSRGHLKIAARGYSCIGCSDVADNCATESRLCLRPGARAARLGTRSRVWAPSASSCSIFRRRSL